MAPDISGFATMFTLEVDWQPCALIFTLLSQLLKLLCLLILTLSRVMSRHQQALFDMAPEIPGLAMIVTLEVARQPCALSLAC